ncbi:regulator of DNA class I crossover intermediates 1 [Chlamydotis macqueenii]
MNWVGGSRSRIILKQERRKQKEFFEKKKLKSKMKLLGVSSPKSSAVSLDLLNLYVVNQISTKKDSTENMRKPVHVDITEGVKIPVRRHNIELPMSPLHTQRMPNLDDIQNRLQQQVLDSRRQHLSEKEKYQHNFATRQEKESKFGVSSTLHEMEKDAESSLSSQSPNYSPRQTESCFSSSPDTSEEEDTAKKKEYLNEQSLKTDDANLVSASASTELPKTSHTGTTPLQPSSILCREDATHLQEKDSVFCATEEENKNPSEGSSLDRALGREHVTGSTRCDVWSQTENSVTEVEKVDVATQCGTIQVCSCGSSLPSAHSLGALHPPGTPGTAGGHKMPAHEALRPAGTGGAAGIAAFSPEAEYLSLAGRRTLEVLSYIDTMKERDKQ